MVSDSLALPCSPATPQRKSNTSYIFQVSILGAYVIANGFFSVFGMCVDTLFLCFCK